jgi:diamine N-acetyltransferase
MNDSLSISAPKFSLRPLKEKDAPRMLEWMNDPDSTQFLKIGGKTYTIEDTLSFIKNAEDESKYFHRAIVNNNDEYLGTISLKNIDYEKKEAEYAIAMHPDARSTGAALWATQTIFGLAKSNLNLRRIYLNVLEGNIRANKFYKKLEVIGLKNYKKTRTTINRSIHTMLWYEVIF